MSGNKSMKKFLLLIIYSFCFITSMNLTTAKAADDNIGAGLFAPDQSKLISLTFDDGPHYKYTPAILDALKKHKAKATFFVIGDRIKYTPEILERMKKEGHEIGNHTYTHVELTGVKTDRLRREIQKTNDAINEITMQKTNLIRPPLGARNKRTDGIVKEEGMSIILWTIDTKDWTGQKAEKIFGHVKKNARDGDIVLMHDFYPETVEAVEKILDEMTGKGYKFVTVSELLKKKFDIEPGKVYYSQNKVLK